MDTKEYINALQSHDWFYEFSDAYNTDRWTNGHKARTQLHRAALDLDPGYKIWDEHAPDLYKMGD